MNLKLYIIFLISPFFLLAQEDSSVEGRYLHALSKIEQLILDIESEIDIEKSLILVDLILKKNN